MKPQLFLRIAFLFSINMIPTPIFADYSKYTDCQISVSCGGISAQFPFWGGGRNDYCGRPELELTCQDSIPKFTVNSTPYRILSFNTTEQNLTVARDDYYNSLCPSEYKNTTLDPTVFRYNGGLVNMTLLHNCSSSVTGLSNQSCNSSGGKSSILYYAEGIEYIESCTNIVIPIFNAFAANLSVNNGGALQDVINNGFSLQLVDNDKCNTCMNSTGECGYLSGQFTCLCKDGAHSTSCTDGHIIDKDKRKNHIFLQAFLIPLVFIIAVITLLISCKILPRKAKENDQHIVEFIKNQEALATKKYSYSDVKKMTNKFVDKLGQGGYGSVYRGRLSDGRLVAVKLLNQSKEDREDFINEVASISRTSHINVVSLLGFCYEGSKRALIYEFMSNGSLDKFIYNRGTSTLKSNLKWKTLYEIAIGIAQGLEYLHRGCNMRILHFDIKPHNILLDDKFCPKISDFGLAKLHSRDKSAISMLGARGTIGYIAPEVFNRNFGRVSHKSDVYSYGMMVFEMVGARNGTNLEVSQTDSEPYFPNNIYKSLEAGHALQVDGVTNEEEEKILRKMVLVSLWCIQTNPIDRPSMTKVLEMLEGNLQSLPFPPMPFLSSPPRCPPITNASGSYSTKSLLS